MHLYAPTELGGVKYLPLLYCVRSPCPARPEKQSQQRITSSEGLSQDFWSRQPDGIYRPRTRFQSAS